VNDENIRGRRFRFGVFDLDISTGELHKDGKPIPRIRDQAFRILVMLLESPGNLVTREDLRERLWASDTFVDFDHGLNSAINQLRNALGDSAASPRFIQTLPRRGYRFIAPVQPADRPQPAMAREIREALAQNSDAESSHPAKRRPLSASEHQPSLLSDPQDLPAVPDVIMRILFSLIQIMYLIFYVLSLARLSTLEKIFGAEGSLAMFFLVLLIVSAAAGIPVRLYLLSAAAFNYRGLTGKFLKLFPFILPLDELWSLAPFLLVEQIGPGLAIAFTAALVYLPFSQRSLLLMGSKNSPAISSSTQKQ
jgi:cholera toxin transcriptional activator